MLSKLSARFEIKHSPHQLEIVRLALAFGVAAGAMAILAGSTYDVPTPPLPETALLGVVLVALAAIDARTRTLPDALTLPLAISGLVLAPHHAVLAHVMAALACYGAMAALAWLYERARGRPGLGLGDAKMLAAGGAWLGPDGVPAALLIACALALLGAALLEARGRIDRESRIPFGPFLAAGIWSAWLFGPLHLLWLVP